MGDAKRESENQKNEQDPYGYLIEPHFHKKCVCLGEWLRSANEILNFNDIENLLEQPKLR